jgi:hypothetical protein
MSWVLVLSMFTNPSGYYAQAFTSEQQCLTEMHKLVKKIEKNDETNVQSLACLPEEKFAMMIGD